MPEAKLIFTIQTGQLQNNNNLLRRFDYVQLTTRKKATLNARLTNFLFVI